MYATLVLHNQTINFFCIYRRPPSRKNKLSFTLFLEEFPNFCWISEFLLDFSNSITGKTIILGDFNLHFDQPNSPDVSQILESLQMFDLMTNLLTDVDMSWIGFFRDAMTKFSEQHMFLIWHINTLDVPPGLAYLTLHAFLRPPEIFATLATSCLLMN